MNNFPASSDSALQPSTSMALRYGEKEPVNCPDRSPQNPFSVARLLSALFLCQHPYMIRSLISVLALVFVSPVLADDAAAVLALWGAQAGPWTGEIDIYGPDDKAPQTVGLKTRWDAVPDYSIVTKTETFVGVDGETSSVTVMFVDADGRTIVTPYFANGLQRNYQFSVVSVTVVDPTHWTTVIATPHEQEIYEGRPAVLRYVRTRTGDKIENTKEVNFLDDIGDNTYELRSLVQQTLSPGHSISADR